MTTKATPTLSINALSLSPGESLEGQDLVLTLSLSNYVGSVTGETITINSIYTALLASDGTTTWTYVLGTGDVSAVYAGNSDNESATATFPVFSVPTAQPDVGISDLGASRVGEYTPVQLSMTGQLGDVTSSQITLSDGSVATFDSSATTTVYVPSTTTEITADYTGDFFPDVGINLPVSVSHTVNTPTKYQPSLSIYRVSPSNARAVLSGYYGSVAGGVVQLSDGSTSTTGTFDVTGEAVIGFTSPSPGQSKTLSATFSGNSNNLSATSSISVSTPATTLSTDLRITTSKTRYELGESITANIYILSGASSNVTLSDTSTLFVAAGSTPTTWNYGTATSLGALTLSATLGSTTASVELLVVQASPSIIVSAPSTVTIGSDVTLVVSIAGSYGSVTGEDIIINDNDSYETTIQLSSLGRASYTYTSTAVGTSSFMAIYGGDTYNDKASSIYVNVVTQPVTPSLLLTSTKTTWSISETPVIQASLTGFYGSVDGETVYFSDGTSGILDSSGAVSWSYFPSSLETSISLTAVYPGDINNTYVTGDIALTLVKADPLISLNLLTTDSVVQGLAVLVAISVQGGFQFDNQILYLSDGSEIVYTTSSPVHWTYLPVSSTTLTVSYLGNKYNNPSSGSLPLAVTPSEQAGITRTQLSLSLSLDFDTVTTSADFYTGIRQDIANLFQVPISRVSLVDVIQGSVIVKFVIVSTQSASELQMVLGEAIADTQSTLYSGTYTRSTTPDYLPTVEVITTTSTPWTTQPIFVDGTPLPTLMTQYAVAAAYYDSGSATIHWNNFSQILVVYIAVSSDLSVTFTYNNASTEEGSVSQVSSLSDTGYIPKAVLRASSTSLMSVTFSPGYARFQLQGVGSYIAFQSPVPACFSKDTVFTTRTRGQQFIVDLQKGDWIRADVKGGWVQVINVGYTVVVEDKYGQDVTLFKVRTPKGVICISDRHMFLSKNKTDIQRMMDPKKSRRDCLKEVVMGKYLYLLPTEMRDAIARPIPWDPEVKSIRLYHVVVDTPVGIAEQDGDLKRCGLYVNGDILSESCSATLFHQLMNPLF